MSPSKVIGAALNSVTSLFNNSCDVNTVKFHQGRKTIMLARYFLSHKESDEKSTHHQERHQSRGRGLRLLWPTLFPGNQFVDVKFHICIFNTGIINNTQKLSATVKS